MADIKFSTKSSPLVYAGNADINATYGPWNSLDDANNALNTIYARIDIFGNPLETKIPAGTTVGVYTDSTKKLVTEYWWINDSLVLKNYTNNYYSLIFTNEKQEIINKIFKENNYNPSELHIKRYDSQHNSSKDNFGSLKYQYNNQALSDVEDNKINLTGIENLQTLTVYWIDDSGNIITFKTIHCEIPEDITQYFYKSFRTTPEVGKDYRIPSKDTSEYQTFNWNPASGTNNEHWSTTKTGILEDTPYEYCISRTRIGGIWQDALGPTMSARWGTDAVSSYNRQAIYTLSDLLNSQELSDDYNIIANQSFQQQDINEVVSQINILGLKHQYRTEQNKPSPTLSNKYLYVLTRERNPDDGSWGRFAQPVVYSSISEDGKDAATVEYIYCRTESTELVEDSAELNEFNQIIGATANKTFDEIASTYSYWTDDSQGVGINGDKFYKVEWCAKRTIIPGIPPTYESWQGPFRWAVYGDTGNDGAGIEYIYILSEIKPSIDTSSPDSNGKTFQDDEYLPQGWNDNYTAVSHTNPKSWYSYRKGSTGHWGEFTEPKIWKEYEQPYELFLDNDVTEVPSENGQPIPLALATATKTGIVLKRGNEIIDSSQYTIKCEDTTITYAKSSNGLWQWASGAITFNQGIANITLYAESTDGTKYASRTQTIKLSPDSTSYKLLMQPNSRIWFDNDKYSTTSFSPIIQKLSADGTLTTLSDSDLDGFSIKVQSAQPGSVEEVISSLSGNIEYNKGEKYDLYFSLYKGDNLTDTETVDTVDYSSIVGQVGVGYTLSMDQDSTEIAFTLKGTSNYLQEKLKNNVRVYKNSTLMPITDITVNGSSIKNSPYTLSYLEEVSDFASQPTISARIYTNYAELNISVQELLGSLSIPITVHFNDEANEVQLTKVWNIKLGDRTANTYSFYVQPQSILLSPTTGASSEQLICEVYNDTLQKPLSETKEQYKISWKLVQGNNELNPAEVYNDLTISLSGVKYSNSAINKYELTLYVQNDSQEWIKKGYQEVDVIPLPGEPSDVVTVELSNPIIKLPLGGFTDSDLSGIVTPYINGSKDVICTYVPSLVEKEYVYIVGVDTEPSINDTTASDNYSFKASGFTSKGTYTKDITIKIYKYISGDQRFQSTVSELWNQEADYTIDKTVTIVITDETTYQFKVNPGSVSVENGASYNLSNFSFEIYKYVPGKSAVKMQKTDAQNELNIYYQIDGSSTRSSLAWTNVDANLQITKNAPISNLVSFDLEAKDGNWQDSDSITIVKNGAAGPSGVDGRYREYIYCLTNTDEAPTQPLYSTEAEIDALVLEASASNPVPITYQYEQKYTLEKQYDITNTSTIKYHHIRGYIGISDNNESNNNYLAKNDWSGYSSDKVISKDGIVHDTEQYNAIKWTDNPQGISYDWQYEWMTYRDIDPSKSDAAKYGKFVTPTLWAKYGEKGQDGDGINYVFCCVPNTITSNQLNKDTILFSDNGSLENNCVAYSSSSSTYYWSENPTTVNNGFIQWVCICRRKYNSSSNNYVWSKGTPSVWNKYISSGTNGYSIRYCGEYSSTTYYCCKSFYDTSTNNYKDNASISYIDVVSKYNASNDTTKYYEALKGSQDTPNIGQRLTNTSYWKETQSYGTVISEDLITKSINAAQITAKEIIISETKTVGDQTETTIKGGLVNKPVNNVLLWGGGSGNTKEDSVNSATFKVYENGTIFAKNGQFQGLSTNGATIVNVCEQVNTNLFKQPTLVFTGYNGLSTKLNKDGETGYIIDITETTSYDFEIIDKNIQYNASNNSSQSLQPILRSINNIYNIVQGGLNLYLVQNEDSTQYGQILIDLPSYTISNNIIIYNTNTQTSIFDFIRGNFYNNNDQEFENNKAKYRSWVNSFVGQKFILSFLENIANNSNSIKSNSFIRGIKYNNNLSPFICYPLNNLYTGGAKSSYYLSYLLECKKDNTGVYWELISEENDNQTFNTVVTDNSPEDTRLY